MENISVTGEFGRKPVLAFDGTPSGELVVEVLHAGDGQVVEAGDTITCHYYGAVFGSKNDFDNSFDRGGALSFQIGVGMVIPGWDEGLVGKRVGDRVLLSITHVPPRPRFMCGPICPLLAGQSRAGDARARVALVAAGILEQVLLVIVLGVPESRVGIGIGRGGENGLDGPEASCGEDLLVGRAQGGRVVQLLRCRCPDL